MNQTSQNSPVISEEDFQQLTSTQKPHRIGLTTILIIFGIFGLWATFVKIDTTVPANGKVIAQGYKKMIQHPTGGRISKLYVKEGDKVKKEDPILQLENRELLAQLRDAQKQFDELFIKKIRLEAEAFGTKPDFDSYQNKLFLKKNAFKLLSREKAIYESDIKQQLLYRKQIEAKNDILRSQNRALQETISSSQRLLKSYEKEMRKWQQLYDENITDELKIFDLERTIEQTRSRIAQSQAQIQTNKTSMLANRKELQLNENRFIREARHQLKETVTTLSSLQEKIGMLAHEIKQSTVRSPDDGIIVDMSVHAVGEVVPPQKPIAYVVPNRTDSILEAFIDPTDIDKVKVGQLAEIHFPSYVDPSSIPVEGKITYVSADTVIPQGSQVPFYKILIKITANGQQAIEKNGFKVIPGMPIAASIKAGKRSFASYILLPLEQLMRGAFHAN